MAWMPPYVAHVPAAFEFLFRRLERDQRRPVVIVVVVVGLAAGAGEPHRPLAHRLPVGVLGGEVQPLQAVADRPLEPVMRHVMDREAHGGYSTKR